MFRFITILGIGLVLSTSAFASEDTVSYIAKNNGEGRFCARVEEEKFGQLMTQKRCRTIEGWHRAGYEVSYWTKKQ